MKKLKQNSGVLLSNLALGDEASAASSIDQLVKAAILVHAGENGERIEFQSSDGPIVFDKERILGIVKKHNLELGKLAAQYGGFEKMPLGAYPPILDSHEDESMNRVVGRLFKPLRYEERNVPKVGVNVPCVVTEVLFLGPETVSKVKDGRIFHLSIGIDEDSDTLGETSVVVTPAAPGAMLLKKMKQQVGTKGNRKKMPNQAKTKAAQKKLSQKSLKKQKIQSAVKKLSAQLAETQKKFQLSAKKATIKTRLSALCAERKLTPAEYKTYTSSKKLLSLSPEHLKITLDLLGEREMPVIPVGQIGTRNAQSYSQLGKKMKSDELKQLKSEATNFMLSAGQKLAKKDCDEDEDEDEKKMAGEPDEEVEKKMAAMPGAITDPAAQPGAISQNPLDDGSQSDLSQMLSDQQDQINEIQTQMARLIGLMDEDMNADDTEEGDSDDSVLAEGDEDEDDDAEMSDSDDDEDDEKDKKDLSDSDEDKDKKDMAESDDDEDEDDKAKDKKNQSKAKK